jgi:copper chaperone CopZ
VGKRGESVITIPVTGMSCASCVGRVERDHPGRGVVNLQGGVMDVEALFQ